VCVAAQPERILDLGSGFSSYVLRYYAASTGHDVSVVSVDDSEAWLERTRQFLADNALETGELRTWSDFVPEPGEPFDLIFHDLAGGELRETGMSVAVRALAPRGLIVFDDAHHPGHRRAARRVAREAGLATYSLYRWTRDAYGRFAMLGSA
jgi:predicted O-methyltransferase YrrM